MASGRLGAADLSATTNTTVYTCPASTYAVVAVNVCNRDSTGMTIRLAVADADSPNAAEYIEYDTSVFGNNVLERTGIVLSASQRIVAYSSAANASVVVVGIETPA